MMEENPYASPDADVDRPEPGDAAGMLAGRGRRLGGAIIDSLVGSVVVIPFMIYFGYFARLMNGEALNLSESVLFAALYWAMFIMINGYWLHTRGQTVGKKLVGTRIVGLDDSNLGLPRIFLLRYLPVGLLSQIPIFGAVTGIIDVVLIFKSDRRCLHDHIAGSKVVMA